MTKFGINLFKCQYNIQSAATAAGRAQAHSSTVIGDHTTLEIGVQFLAPSAKAGNQNFG